MGLRPTGAVLCRCGHEQRMHHRGRALWNECEVGHCFCVRFTLPPWPAQQIELAFNAAPPAPARAMEVVYL